MNEPELRALVRDVIARDCRTGRQSPARARFDVASSACTRATGCSCYPWVDGDGPCLIEPAVICNHCGYCKSYGH